MAEKKKKLEKVGNYAKYVKEMYWPKVSEKKRLELQPFLHNHHGYASQPDGEIIFGNELSP